MHIQQTNARYLEKLVINFYAQGETDGITFEVYFSAASREKAEEFAEKIGWKLIGQEEKCVEEDYAMFEFIMTKSRLH